MATTLCTSCDTQPEPGVYLEPREARHMVVIGDGEDGPDATCTWCAVALLFGTETYGSRVTLTVTPALAEAVA